MMQIRVMRSAGVMSRLQWTGRGLLSRRSAPVGGEIRCDKSFRSSELSAIPTEQEIARGRRASARVPRKTAKPKAVKLLKTYDSTKSSDFAPNDVNDLLFRFFVTGFGAQPLEKARLAPKPREAQRGRGPGRRQWLGSCFRLAK